MAEAAQDDAWHHTSSLLALLFNCHRDPKRSSPARPADFHPLTPAAKPLEIPKQSQIRLLKKTFT